MYCVGFDPGYVKLGIGILNCKTFERTMVLVNLTEWSGVKHHLLGRDMWFVVYSLIGILYPILSRANYVGIEEQPPMTNPKVATVKNHLESIIRMQFPSVPVYLVSPRSVRAYWKTSGKTYLERKENSLHTNLLADTELKDALVQFNDSVDPIEAMQLCIYVYTHYIELANKNIENVERVFTISVYTTQPCLKKSKYFTPTTCKSKYFLPDVEVNQPDEEQN